MADVLFISTTHTLDTRTYVSAYHLNKESVNVSQAFDFHRGIVNIVANGILQYRHIYIDVDALESEQYMMLGRVLRKAMAQGDTDTPFIKIFGTNEKIVKRLLEEISSPLAERLNDESALIVTNTFKNVFTKREFEDEYIYTCLCEDGTFILVNPDSHNFQKVADQNHTMDGGNYLIHSNINELMIGQHFSASMIDNNHFGDNEIVEYTSPRIVELNRFTIHTR